MANDSQQPAKHLDRGTSPRTAATDDGALSASRQSDDSYDDIEYSAADSSSAPIELMVRKQDGSDPSATDTRFPVVGPAPAVPQTPAHASATARRASGPHPTDWEEVTPPAVYPMVARALAEDRVVSASIHAPAHQPARSGIHASVSDQGAPPVPTGIPVRPSNLHLRRTSATLDVPQLPGAPAPHTAAPALPAPPTAVAQTAAPALPAPPTAVSPSAASGNAIPKASPDHDTCLTFPPASRPPAVPTERGANVTPSNAHASLFAITAPELPAAQTISEMPALRPPADVAGNAGSAKTAVSTPDANDQVATPLRPSSPEVRATAEETTAPLPPPALAALVSATRGREGHERNDSYALAAPLAPLRTSTTAPSEPQVAAPATVAGTAMRSATSNMPHIKPADSAGVATAAAGAPAPHGSSSATGQSSPSVTNQGRPGATVPVAQPHGQTQAPDSVFSGGTSGDAWSLALETAHHANAPFRSVHNASASGTHAEGATTRNQATPAATNQEVHSQPPFASSNANGADRADTGPHRASAAETSALAPATFARQAQQPSTPWLAIGLAAGLAATTAFAAERYVAARTQALAAQLSAKAQVPVQIGRIDAGLTATVRISDIAIGKLFAAQAFEARVGFRSLLQGDVTADEILVEAPRLNEHVDANGQSELRALFRRFAAEVKRKPTAQARFRRIVVSRGELRIALDRGLIAVARDVELAPTSDGVRVVTGPVEITGEIAARPPFPAVRARMNFARTAADVALPNTHVVRGIAVGGEGHLGIGADRATVSQLAVVHTGGGQPAQLVARIDDHGVPRMVRAQAVATRPYAVRVTANDVPLDLFASLAPAQVDVRGAHATGTLTFAHLGRRDAISAAGTLSGIKLRSDRLDDTTIEVAPQVAIDAVLDRNGNGARLTVTEASATIAPATLFAKGELVGGRSRPLVGHFEVTLDRTDCAAALAAIPPSIRGPLDGLAVTGTISGGVAASIDLTRPAGEGIELSSTFDPSKCVVSADPPLADVAALRGPVRHTFPGGRVRMVGPGAEGWVGGSSIPPLVRGAFVSAEDGRYYKHDGFDLYQIARSLEIDLRERRLLRGGSTISQQLIKNEFLTHRRSFGRKLQEAVLTWRLEATLSKEEILDRYLNIIELGPDIFGAAAAAKFWFDKPLRDLHPRQVAFLAALTSEPKSMTRRLRNAGTLDPASAARVDIVLRAMRRDAVIDNETYTNAKDAPLHFRREAIGSGR